MKPNFQGFVEPQRWAPDDGARREPVLDADLDRVVRYVGYRKCMRCGQLFWSDDVQRLRLCAWNGVNPGCRTRNDDDGIGKPCTAHFVVSGAVARSPGEAAPSHSEPSDVNSNGRSQERGGSFPVRPGLQRVPLAPVVVCAAARALRAAQAAITTLSPLGYWRARHAACSGVLAGRQGTGNTEFGGLAG